MGVGLYVVAICVSGSILVYRNELYAAFAPPPGGPVPLGFRATAWLLDFHDNLLSGVTGRRANGIGALLVFIMCATGAVIWWPGTANWRSAITMNWRARSKPFTWRLHSALGFWFFSFILMWAISGAYLSFPRAFQAFFDYLEPLDEQNPVERVGDTIQYWIAYLHFGRLGGRGIIPGCGRRLCNEVTKAVWAVFGLVPPIMVVTGIVMWWNRVVGVRDRVGQSLAKQ
jgi:uncharacterized iron-regulated membrane protein